MTFSPTTKELLTELADSIVRNTSMYTYGVRVKAQPFVDSIVSAVRKGCEFNCVPFEDDPVKICAEFQSEFLRERHLHCSYSVEQGPNKKLVSYIAIRYILPDSKISKLDVTEVIGGYADDENYALEP